MASDSKAPEVPGYLGGSAFSLRDQAQTIKSQEFPIKQNESQGVESELKEEQFWGKRDGRKGRLDEKFNPEEDLNDFLEMNRETIGAYLQTQKKKEAPSLKKGRVGSQSVQSLQKSSLRLGERQENPNRLPEIHKKLYIAKKRENEIENKNAYSEANELQSLLRPKKSDVQSKPNMRGGQVAYSRNY